MKILLFEEPESVSEEQLARDLLLLPAWRRRRVMEYRFLTDRVLCAKAYLLLKEGLYREYGIREDPAFSYGENGKPYLRDHPGIYFNLSHCRRGVLCVIDEQEVGCDIEEIPDSLDDALCDYCCSETEKRSILSASDPAAEFTRLWTMKEAYLKYTGQGISDDLPELLEQTDLTDISFRVKEEKKGVVYTICNSLRRDRQE